MNHFVFVIFLLRIIEIFVVLFVQLGVRGRKAGIDILWPRLVLGSFDDFLAIDVGLLQWTIFVQRPTYKIGRVW